jgi:mRNA interferase RelE/StbE
VATPDCYKIKITSPQYRLVYQVFDDRIVIEVICVAPRDWIYREIGKRLS